MTEKKEEYQNLLKVQREIIRFLVKRLAGVPDNFFEEEEYD